jgi:hypothetical protein
LSGFVHLNHNVAKTLLNSIRLAVTKTLLPVNNETDTTIVYIIVFLDLRF